MFVATGAGLGADLGSAPPGRGQVEPPVHQWTLSFTPYSWLSGLDGKTTVKGRTTDIDVSPLEVLEHLDGVPWMSYSEARIGRLALYSDILYAPLGVDASGARSVGRVSLDATLGVDIEQTIIEVGATYEIAKWLWGGIHGAKVAGYTAIDILAGARYWHQEVEINLALTTTLERRRIDPVQRPGRRASRRRRLGGPAYRTEASASICTRSTTGVAG